MILIIPIPILIFELLSLIPWIGFSVLVMIRLFRVDKTNIIKKLDLCT